MKITLTNAKQLVACLLLLLLGRPLSGQIWKNMQPVMENNWAGVVTCLSMHPTRPNEILAGTIGGLYLSNDGGGRWDRLNAFPGATIYDVAYCPSNPDIILGATFSTGVLSHRVGLYRSADHGRTWTAAVNPYSVTAACPSRCAATCISWVPGRSTVYVATDCGLIKSVDNGLTWSAVPLGSSPALPNDPSNLFVVGGNRVVSVLALDATHVVAGRSSDNYYTSDGSNWNRSNANFGADVVRGFCRVPGRSNVVFGTGWASQGIQYSTDYGATWSLMPGNPIPGGNNGPMLRASKSRSGLQEFELYYGDGVGLYKGLFKSDLSDLSTGRFQGYVYRSGTNGDRMTHQHDDFRDLVFNPDDGTPFLLAGDGGVQRWEKDKDCFKMTGGNVGGLNALEIRGLGVHWQADMVPRVNFITWHNGGALTKDNGLSWSQWGSLESQMISVPESPLTNLSDCRIAMGEKSEMWECGGQGLVNLDWPGGSGLSRHLVLFKHPVTGRQWYLVATWGFGGTNVGYHVRPVEGGPWKLVATSNFGSPWGVPIVGRRGTNVVMYHPVEVSGKKQLLVIDNVLSTVPVSPRLPMMSGFGSLPLGQGGSLFDLPIACDPMNAQNLIAADALQGTVLRSRDGGESWQAMTNLTRLITANGSILFNLVSNSCQVNEIAYDPTNPNRVFVGTEDSGVFASFDGGATWNSINPTNIKLLRVSELAVGPKGELYVGTLGAGLWKCSF